MLTTHAILNLRNSRCELQEIGILVIVDWESSFPTAWTLDAVLYVLAQLAPTRHGLKLSSAMA